MELEKTWTWFSKQKLFWMKDMVFGQEDICLEISQFQIHQILTFSFCLTVSICGSLTPVLMTLEGMPLPPLPCTPTGMYFTFPICPRPTGSARSSPIAMVVGIWSESLNSYLTAMLLKHSCDRWRSVLCRKTDGWRNIPTYSQYQHPVAIFHNQKLALICCTLEQASS